jgi:hypothetical protein
VANSVPRDVALERSLGRPSLAELERDLLAHGGTSTKADRERGLVVTVEKLRMSGAVVEQRSDIAAEEDSALFERESDCGRCFDEPVHASAPVRLSLG